MALRRAGTAALCPDPTGFSFAIVGAMLTQVIVGSREAQKAIAEDWTAAYCRFFPTGPTFVPSAIDAMEPR